MIRTFFIVALLAISHSAYSGGYTPWATPTMTEVVSGGIVIYGAFGNQNGCTHSDSILYPNTYVDYEVVVSMVLTAMTAGKELRWYSHDCDTFVFHGGTINRARNGQAIYLR